MVSKLVEIGRMVEPVEIVAYVKSFFVKKIFKGQKIVITAGPTVEKIDPVRFISNYSSGKMGYAIAHYALMMGAEVTLISGPSSCSDKNGINLINVESSSEMHKASLEAAKDCDIFIGVAAVCDYSPVESNSIKIKKGSSDLTITFKHTIDIIFEVKKSFPNIFIVGFAAETNNFHEYGLKKLKEKKLDLIAINDVSNGKVFGRDENELHIISRDEQDYYISKKKKEEVAKELLKIIYHNHIQTL